MQRLNRLVALVAVVFMSLHFAYANDDFTTQYSAYCQKLKNRPILDVEGIWQWSDGSCVLIEADANARLQITLISSPDPLVTTPQVWGQGTPAGDKGTYDFVLHPIIDGDTGRFTSATHMYIAKLTEPGVLTLHSYSTALKVDIRRIIPILSRIHIHRDQAPQSLDGAIRIYPHALSPRNPVVL